MKQLYSRVILLGLAFSSFVEILQGSLLPINEKFLKKDAPTPSEWANLPKVTDFFAPDNVFFHNPNTTENAYGRGCIVALNGQRMRIVVNAVNIKEGDTVFLKMAKSDEQPSLDDRLRFAKSAAQAAVHEQEEVFGKKETAEERRKRINAKIAEAQAESARWSAREAKINDVFEKIKQEKEKAKENAKKQPWYVKWGTVENIRASLAKEESLEAIDEEGASALLQVVKGFAWGRYNDLEGGLDAIGELLKHGANINARDKHEDTALMWAANCEDKTIVNFLLDHGADADLKGKTGLAAC